MMLRKASVAKDRIIIYMNDKRDQATDRDSILEKAKIMLQMQSASEYSDQITEKRLSDMIQEVHKDILREIDEKVQTREDFQERAIEELKSTLE